MGGKSSAQPSSSGIYESMASAAAAQQSYKFGEDTLQFAKDQWAHDQPAIDAAASAELGATNQQNWFSSTAQDNYAATTLPLLNRYTDQAQNWDTPAQEAQNAGSAEASVASSMEGQRNSALQQLESFGVDPSSTRYAALDFGSRAAEGAAQGAAGTSAIQATKLQGMGLEQSAIQGGQGIAGTSVGAASAGTGAAGTAAGATTAGLTASTNAMTAGSAWYNSGANNMNTYTNAVNGFNYAQNQATSINNQASSGIGSAVGGIFGDLTMMKLADGGPTDPSDQTPGGQVPMQASPTGGQAIDDVPAQLTAGEFVMPKDVVEWEGQKAFYGMIDKARKGRQQAIQRPDVGGKPVPAQQAIQGPPAFASRPGQFPQAPQQTPQQAIQ